MGLETLKLSLDRHNSSVLLLDKTARIAYANPALEYRNGFTPSEAFEKNPSDLWGKQMTRAYYASFWGTLKRQGKVVTTIQNLHANGQLVSERLHVLAIPHNGTRAYLELQPGRESDDFQRQFLSAELSDFQVFRNFFEDYFVSLGSIDSFESFAESLTQILRSVHEDRLTDRAIIESAGHPKQALTQLYDRYQGDVFRYFRSKIGVTIAEDLTQDVFLAAYRAFADYHPNASYKTYLLRVAHNRYVDFLRQQHSSWCSLEDAHMPQQRPNQAFQSATIDWSLLCETLTAQERALLIKHYLEGYKLKEIANDWGVTENAIKLRLSRLRKRIQGVA